MRESCAAAQRAVSRMRPSPMARANWRRRRGTSSLRIPSSSTVSLRVAYPEPSPPNTHTHHHRRRRAATPARNGYWGQVVVGMARRGQVVVARLLRHTHTPGVAEVVL